MNYNEYFKDALNSLKKEGRYRVFNDIKRNIGKLLTLPIILKVIRMR